MSSHDGTVDEQRALSILMPVFNEAATVERAIEEVLEVDLPLPVELIVVDDGSTDGTAAILERRSWPTEVTILSHQHNQGKGSAVRTALTKASGDFCAIFDADLEYEAADLADLLEPLMAGQASVVYGVRAFGGHTSHSFLYVMGNKGVTLVANVLFNVYLKDLMTCHKVIRTDIFQSLSLRACGFAIEPEITARVLQRGQRIFEMPVNYKARSNEQGKKLTAADGVRVVWTLARCRLSRR